ncbi:Calreticulin [Rhynchospora pubera]|uniref:Calreticulin n=1 Tax=Rhynchospora pubera TaxID=906938 RepID=A0AAV8DJP9_9POAL|nr:Calreticulin [Rhynchospora pubera]
MAIRPRYARAVCIVAALLAFSAVASSEVFFEERFGDGWETRWVKSDWKRDDGMAGEWVHTAGKWNGDPEDKGIQTSEDYRFYAISAEFLEFTNRDKTLVLQFSVKHEQKLDCGGGYIKLISGDIDQKAFSGDTPYSIMFGPDICGDNTRRVHAIFSHNGTNHLHKKDVMCMVDQLTHVYTLIVKPDATYSILIDNVQKDKGSLYEDWDILPPRKLPDTEATKPEDWVEDEYIPDPEDKKPEGYDDIPKEIPDPNALKPDNWDDEEDGEWTAPKIPNPEYHGPWKQRKMKNPDYKGKWTTPMLDNPEFVDDPYLYAYPRLKYIGIELWQVKSGTLFDNILVCDDPEYAFELTEETWGKHKDTEEAQFEQAWEKMKEEEEAEKKRQEEEEAKNDESEASEDKEESNDDAEAKIEETVSNDSKQEEAQHDEL